MESSISFDESSIPYFLKCVSYLIYYILEANEKSKKEDILKLAEGHILQKTELRGRYQRKH